MSGDFDGEEGQIRDRLGQFGFSEKAIDAYLSIVDHGRVKPSTIAEEANVSTSYVYQVCAQLEEDGLITVDDHRTPAVIHANPPGSAFDHLIDELESVSEAVASRYERPQEPEERFRVVKSRSTLIDGFVEMIDEAESEIAIQVTRGIIPDLRPALRRAIDRGVLVLCVVATEGRTVNDLHLDEVATVVRVGIDEMPTFVSVDQQSGALAPPGVTNWSHTDDAAISFVQENLAPILLGSFLGNYWPMSEEIMVRRLRELPRTYTWFRPAVYDATTHLRAGHDVIATLETRPTKSDQQFEQLEVPVVDTCQNMVEPRTSSFGFENNLVVEVDGEHRSVGGRHAFLEDYEATSVTLSVAGE